MEIKYRSGGTIVVSLEMPRETWYGSDINERAEYVADRIREHLANSDYTVEDI